MKKRDTLPSAVLSRFIFILYILKNDNFLFTNTAFYVRINETVLGGIG